MSARPGFVLLYALLLVLTAATITAAMLALGTREAMIAHRYTLIGRARAAAEAEARRSVDSWSTTGLRHLPRGDARTLPSSGAPALVVVARLSRTLFLVTAESRIPAGAGPPVIARAGMLVRTLDLEAVDAAFPAAVVASGTAAMRGGQASGRDECRPGAPARAGIMAPVVTAEGTRLEGDPPAEVVPPTAPPPAWPLAPGTVRVLADIEIADPAVSPTPAVRDGVCAPGPLNWGALSRLHPCAARRPIVYAPGDLTIRGGEGAGILVVDGNLRLEGEFRFEGMIVATGGLTASPGTRIRGAIRAQNVALDDTDVLFDSCTVERAIAGSSLDRAYRPGPRWWIPLF